jgi:YXWGXW repeat-containing protein
MKKISRILVLIAVVSLFAVTKSKAQLSINLQLRRPAQYEDNERNHPNQPSANHVWIAEEWVPNNHGSYDYKPGFWALPPRVIWIAGHWTQVQRGYIWIPGHWKEIPQ